MWHDARMSIVEHAPAFAAEEATALAAALFGVEGHAHALPSERDQNFRIDASSGERYVLKIANALEDAAMLDAENAAMEHVAAHRERVTCPRPVAGRDGRTTQSAARAAGRPPRARRGGGVAGVPRGTVKTR